jgi:alpha-beta hydrolase superfamily lysophospholipase
MSGRPEPLYFGPSARQRFGWLHRPNAGVATASVGLVVCNPFGYEAICAHRSLRHFATAASAAGVPALRFDYDGTGDSVGSDGDPDRLASWIASIRDAADALRRLAGVEQVCLLGVRLGALLAACAALERADVAAFVAVAPVVSGRAYMRELRALQMSLGLGEPPPGHTPVDGEREAVGFRITRETHDALSKIDLAKDGISPARRILIVDRDDLPVAENWAERLRAKGDAVDLRRLPGYTEMVLDPHKAKVPEEIIAQVTAWVREAADPHPNPPPKTGEGTRKTGEGTREAVARIAADGGPGVIETATYLDGEGSLFGILTAPENKEASAGPQSKRILLLNAGSIHHVGPNRLYVGFARRWAAMGHVILRADVSGIGDSPPRQGEPENVVYSARAMEDIRLALDALRRRAGPGPTYVMGLCSGAYNAVRAAAAGQAIDGIVPINPLTFFWKEGMSLDYPAHRVVSEARRYSTSVMRLDSWKKVLRREVKLGPVAQVVVRRGAASVARHLRDAARTVGRPFPEDLGTDLGAIAKRGARIRFVFAAGDPGEDLLREQAGSAVSRLRNRGALTVNVIDGPDHTFTPVWSHPVLGDILTSIIREPAG